MRIYIRNLNDQTTRDELREAFSVFGAVTRVGLALDKKTHKPRGFGFIEMDRDEGELAIARLNGTELGNRVINVGLARSMEQPREKPRPT